MQINFQHHISRRERITMTIINLLIAFGLVVIGAVGGVLIMAMWNSNHYDDVLQDAYDKGFEDGQRSRDTKSN